MNRAKQALSVTAYNFRQWNRNPRIIITFCLAFVLCFLLSDKAVQFAEEYDTTMQIVEAFVWTFGDANSILLSSLLLLLLFSDMPFISSGTPFYLMRIDRKTWITGQVIYIVVATAIYLLFILVSTSAVCMRQSFVGDMWSETAAILGYSGAGEAVSGASVATGSVAGAFVSITCVSGALVSGAFVSLGSVLPQETAAEARRSAAKIRESVRFIE